MFVNIKYSPQTLLRICGLCAFSDLVVDELILAIPAVQLTNFLADNL